MGVKALSKRGLTLLWMRKDTWKISLFGKGQTPFPTKPSTLMSLFSTLFAT